MHHQFNDLIIGHFFCAGCGDVLSIILIKLTYSHLVQQLRLSFEINTLGVRNVMKINMLQSVPNVANQYWMKFSMLWGNHGILRDVLYAKFRPSLSVLIYKECGRDFGDEGFFIDSNDNKPMCKSCKHIRLVRQVEKIRA